MTAPYRTEPEVINLDSDPPPAIPSVLAAVQDAARSFAIRELGMPTLTLNEPDWLALFKELDPTGDPNPFPMKVETEHGVVKVIRERT